MIGLDADVVAWHDLAAGHWPGERSTLAEYDARFADRQAVATAAAAGAPALAEPSRVTECRRCPWWPRCEVELERGQDVSLVVRGETAVVLRAIGVHTVASWPPSTRPAAAGPGAGPAVPGHGRAGQSLAARAAGGAPGAADRRSGGPTSRWTWTWRASANPAPTCGVRCCGTRRPAAGDEPAGYRAFATWRPLPTPDEARSFAEFWGWFSRVRASAAATGRTFAAYCYNAQAENRWLLASAERFAGRPGMPTPGRGGRRSSTDPAWVDLYAVVSEWFLCAHGKGLKRIAPVAGFTLA